MDFLDNGSILKEECFYKRGAVLTVYSENLSICLLNSKLSFQTFVHLPKNFKDPTMSLIENTTTLNR